MDVRWSAPRRHVGRRRAGSTALAVLGAAAAIVTFLASPPRGRALGGGDDGPLRAFAAAAGAGGLNRKQTRGTIHTRTNLPPVVEDPLPEPEPEEVPKEKLPERRVPYSLHIVSHFPNNKHLHEESDARLYIEKKIVDAFENSEDMIRHIEVNLQVSENFHRDKPTHTKLQVSPVGVAGSDVAEGEDFDMQVDEPSSGSRMLTPYIFKVTVSLKNQRTIVLANAEKHAQPTLSEGMDHMVDVIRKSLREEKERYIQARKKETRKMSEGDSLDEELPTEELSAMEAESIAEEIELEADKKMEQLYQRVEGVEESK